MLRYLTIFLFFGAVAFADGQKDFTDAVGKGFVDSKLLIVVLKGKAYEFPKDEKLRAMLDANVVVKLDPKALMGEKTFQEYFQLKDDEVADGVLLVIDLRDKTAKTFGTITSKVILEDRTANRILDAVNPPSQLLPAPAPVAPEKPGVATEKDLTELEAGLIEAVNEFRKSEKLPALTVSPELVNAGRAYLQQKKMSAELALKIGDKAGYAGQIVMPVVAEGKMNPDQVVKLLAKDGGTGKTMRGQINFNKKWQDANYTHIGVGTDGKNFVIYFGAPTYPRR